jgi:hypothetical protein
LAYAQASTNSPSSWRDNGSPVAFGDSTRSRARRSRSFDSAATVTPSWWLVVEVCHRLYRHATQFCTRYSPRHPAAIDHPDAGRIGASSPLCPANTMTAVLPPSARSWAGSVAPDRPPPGCRWARLSSRTARPVLRTASPRRPSPQVAGPAAATSPSVVRRCSPRASPPRRAATARPASGALDALVPRARSVTRTPTAARCCTWTAP